MKRNITEIIVHCSATPEGRAVSAAEIDKWHRERGFSRIGYHYVIGLDGSVEKGRKEDMIGAHCTGHNTQSIGVCYIGGLAKNGKTSKDTRTPEQKQSLLQLLKELKQAYPGARIHGHREFAAKDCPCFDVKSEYSNI